jgi:PAS domain S-box-containing protein
LSDAATPSFLSGISYLDIYENLMDGFAIVDMSGAIVVTNAAFREMLGYAEEEIARLKYEDITPASWHEAEAAILRDQVLARGYSDVYEKEYRNKAGLVFSVELRTCLIEGPDGERRGMWAIVRDISARKATEARLKESEERFRGVFEGSALGMALADSSSRLVRVNPSLALMLGYSEEELISKGFLEITHPEDRKLDWDLHLELLAGARESFQIEKRYLRRDGSLIWGRLTTSALRGHSGSGGDLVLGMVEDITDRKAQEERIERSLNEKAVLLKEVHHRVKNNLQLIVSMLALQVSYLPEGHDGDGVRGILADASGRVRSMASIHEIVYSTSDFSGLDFAVYVESIAKEIAVDMAASPLSLQLDLEPVRMDLDTAIPCGLLVNEAMTNILKHAYPRDWAGERMARLSLKPRAGGIASISIADGGVGLPEPGRAEGLGFTIMRALAQQMGGRLAIRSEGGTVVEFEI